MSASDSSACRSSDSAPSDAGRTFSDNVVPVNTSVTVSDSVLAMQEESIINCKYVELFTMVSDSIMYNFQGIRCPVDSSLNMDFWKEHLKGYSDSGIVEFLEFGWPINYVKEELPGSSGFNLPISLM